MKRAKRAYWNANQEKVMSRFASVVGLTKTDVHPSPLDYSYILRGLVARGNITKYFGCVVDTLMTANQFVKFYATAQKLIDEAFDEAVARKGVK